MGLRQVLFFLSIALISRAWILYQSFSPQHHVLDYARIAYSYKLSALRPELGSHSQIYSQLISKRLLGSDNRFTQHKWATRLKIEYPPFAVQLISMLPTPFNGHKGVDLREMRIFTKQYSNQFRILVFVFDMLLLLCLLVLAFGMQLNARAINEMLIWFVLLGFCFQHWLYLRLDVILVALLTLSFVCLLFLKQSWLGLLFFALACHFKISPIFLLPLALVFLARRSSINSKQLVQNLGKHGLVFLGFFASIGALYYFNWGESSLDFFSYHWMRPIQIESLYANIFLVLNSLGNSFQTVVSYGSNNILHAWEPTIRNLATWLTILSTGGFTILCFYLSRKRLYIKTTHGIEGESNQLFFQCICAGFMLLICFAKVSSPQYFLWFAPFLYFSVCSLETKQRMIFLAGFLVIMILTQLIYPVHYHKEIANYTSGPTVFGQFLLHTRNGLLLFYTLFFSVFYLKNMRKRSFGEL